METKIYFNGERLYAVALFAVCQSCKQQTMLYHLRSDRSDTSNRGAKLCAKCWKQKEETA